MFSVVIPTMQGADQTEGFIQEAAAHPLVKEILVVNNSCRPLDYSLPDKARVIYEGSNLYVNPAWNLGAEQASAPLLAIANDDIDVDTAVFDAVAKLYEERNPGMVGPSAESVYEGFTDSEFTASRVHDVNGGYGVLFFLRTADYAPIPDTMKIYAGEYWLFWNQPRSNMVFRGPRIDTVMHTTSGRGEFNQMKVDDVREYEARMAHVFGTQRWHRRAQTANFVEFRLRRPLRAAAGRARRRLRAIFA